jgi:DNA-directed RNA polymerase subunit RPC12/RpoP
VSDETDDLDTYLNSLPIEEYPVDCARCGKIGTTGTFVMEEGDEWECPECWMRCNKMEREEEE